MVSRQGTQVTSKQWVIEPSGCEQPDLPQVLAPKKRKTNTDREMASRAVSMFEAFCFNFIKGLSSNIHLIHTLLHNEGEQPSSPPAQRTPEHMPELARRRAERQRARGERPRRAEDENVSVRALLWKLMVLNTFLGVVCILGMTHLVLPAVGYIIGDLWSQEVEWAVSTFMIPMWLAPLWVASKLSNVFWMNDLSNLAYKKTLGRPVQSDLMLYISDIIYSSVLQLVFIGQIFVCALIPVSVCGFNVVEVVLTAISYSQYAFEYKWMNMAYSVQKRLDLIDKNIAYHLGFGFPLALLVVFFESFWIKFILYSLLFPPLILSANDASEPTDLKGRSTYLFYPSEKVTQVFFNLLHKFGIWRLGKFLLGMVALYVLCCLLPITAVVRYIAAAVVAVMPVDAVKEQWGHVQHSVLEWWRS